LLVLRALQAGSKQEQPSGCGKAADVWWCGSRPAVDGVGTGPGCWWEAHEHVIYTFVTALRELPGDGGVWLRG
jgi:hypothetical protein